MIVCEDADPRSRRLAHRRRQVRERRQVCTSPSRILVHESIYDRFVEALVGAAEAVKVGNGLEEGVRMGPLANPRRLRGGKELVADAVERGATLVAGGKQIEGPGWFFEPTVLADVPLDARVMNEEPFCPIAPVVSFSDLDEALEIANSLPYGLAAYGFTNPPRPPTGSSTDSRRASSRSTTAAARCRRPLLAASRRAATAGRAAAEGLHDYLITKRVYHKLT